jgi:hypothetical protein
MYITYSYFYIYIIFICSLESTIEALENDVNSLQGEVDAIDDFQLELQTKEVCMYIYAYIRIYIRVHDCVN